MSKFGGAELLIIAALYFLPSLIAMYRRHPQEMPIKVVNLFLGWTFIGWVIALAWRVAAIKRPAGE